MKVVYICKTVGQGNDEEGAILHALTVLGNEVQVVPESCALKVQHIPACDLLLFHKWYQPAILNRLEGKTVRCFWYFDLVTWPDPELERRNKVRTDWMEHLLPYVDLGLCTDGDWVGRDKTGKLHVLRQGADERMMAKDVPSPRTDTPIPLLFTGTARGGNGRRVWVNEMISRYRGDFVHVGQGLHGEPLRNKIQKASVVLAPDYPVTDHYWSNRIYLTLGYGGFLLHPYCEELTLDYVPETHLAFYRNRGEMLEQITHYLLSPSIRWKMARSALAHTWRHHTYRHRVRKLLELVEGIRCQK